MNPSVDLNATTPVVTDEKKLRCSHLGYDPGGGGINVSRAITILGGRSKAFFPAGGPVGDFLVDLLRRDDIEHVRFPITSETRLNASFIEESTDKQYRFNMPGASLQDHEWQQILTSLQEFIPSPDFLVVSGSLPKGVPDAFFKKVCEITHEMDCKLIVDTAHEPLRYALQGGVFLIKPNLSEFQWLTGERFQNEQEIIKEAQRMIKENQATYIVISLGAAGAFFIARESYTYLRSPLVPIRSRVGAGDSMVAGITLKLAQNESIEHAVQYGIAAAASAVMTPGTELCRRDDTDHLFQQIMSCPIQTMVKSGKLTD